MLNVVKDSSDSNTALDLNTPFCGPFTACDIFS